MPERGAPPEAWRLFFPLGLVAGITGLVTWVAALHGGPALDPAAHARWMLWGFFGPLVQGFLLTAWHRQHGQPAPGRGLLTLCAVLLTVGLLDPLGADGGFRALAGLARVAGWVVLLVHLLRVIRAGLANRSDPWTSVALVAAVSVLTVACALTHLPATARIGERLAAWGGLLPLGWVLLDRLLPFFSGKRVPGYDGVRRPGFAQAVLPLAVARGALGPGTLAAALDLALLVLLARQWHGWRPLQGLKVPLVGVLHLALAGTALALALDAAWARNPALETAALHLLLVCGMAVMALSIAIRVSRGHGGVGLRLGPDGAVAVALAPAAGLLRGLAPALGAARPVPMWDLPGLCLALALAFTLAIVLPLALRQPR